MPRTRCSSSPATPPQVSALPQPAAPDVRLLTCFSAAADVEKLLKASGSEADTEKLAVLVKNLEGKKLHELVAAGSAKLGSVSAGASTGPAAAAGAAPVEEKEEEKPKEEAEMAEMGDLFGDDDDDQY